jgi:hypothetical protein
MQAYYDIISGLEGQPMGGIMTLCFDSGRYAHIESGFGMRIMAEVFGAREFDGNILECIVGQDIVWWQDDIGMMAAFVPATEFDGDWEEIEGADDEIDTL